MRYPRSSHATSDIGPSTGTTAGYRPSLLSGGITSGRVFWLRGLTFAFYTATSASTGVLEIYDSASAVTATAAPVMLLPGPSVTDTASSTFYSNRMVYNFGAPGIKFSTGITAALEASGRIPPGYVTVWGYEE